MKLEPELSPYTGRITKWVRHPHYAPPHTRHAVERAASRTMAGPGLLSAFRPPPWPATIALGTRA